MKGISEALRDGGQQGRAAKLTYLAVFSSEDYLDGLLVLHESLRRVRSRFPLTVLVAPSVSGRVEHTLNLMGMRTIRSEKPVSVPEEIVERNETRGQPHWSRTFEKLEAFELLEFDKLVYLDSDMMVMRNVDDLFARPHMAAVVAGRGQPGNETWDRLNSGCLVIVPRPGYVDAIWRAVPTALRERDAVGDQDLIQIAHPGWPNQPELHLGEEYNVFFMYLEHYTHTLGFSVRGKRPVKIVHFVGSAKPWTRTSLETARVLAGHARRREWSSFTVLARYHAMLVRARLRSRLWTVKDFLR